jgi:hypothetical protein
MSGDDSRTLEQKAKLYYGGFCCKTDFDLIRKSAGRRQKKKSRRRADNLTRPFETAALIFRAAVSLRLHKPMTTCRDTVADWRLIYRVPFAFSKLT